MYGVFFIVNSDRTLKVSVKIKNAVARIPDLRFREAINLTIYSGQHWAFLGPNGGGKTLLSDFMTGKIALHSGSVDYPLKEGNTPVYKYIKSVAFRDVYGMSDYKQMYYQQRWNSSDIDNSPLAGELIKDLATADEIKELFSFFNIEELLEKQVILFSSGELRKFLIARTMLEKPRILILDNPYIGLDDSSRKLFNDFLAKTAEQNRVQIILLLCNVSDIPFFITDVLPVRDRKLLPPLKLETFLEDKIVQEKLFPVYQEKISLPQALESANTSYDSVLKMENIHIRYGKRTILKDLNWQILKGGKWALLGPNGSGKSTLLSLVYADNPQAYANVLYLFDKKRGSGESIWDIKKHIGYVSPEIHLYYQVEQTALDVVGSGLFDSIGLYRKCNGNQLQEALKWMEVFHISHLKNHSFLKMSSGEQRLVILARAFVKNPDLLILDEPLHGLDQSNKTLVSSIINLYCEQENKALIYVTHYRNEIPRCVENRLELTKIEG